MQTVSLKRIPLGNVNSGLGKAKVTNTSSQYSETSLHYQQQSEYLSPSPPNYHCANILRRLYYDEDANGPPALRVE